MMARSQLHVLPLLLIGLLRAISTDAQVVPSQMPIIGRPVDQDFGKRPDNTTPPSADPRDFNGMYQQVEETDDSAYEPNLVVQCAPHIEIGARGYPEKIFQTPDRLIFIQEFNHIVRRIQLNASFPKEIQPSYVGHSIGHWEGNTLVVTTRGIKGVKAAGGVPVKSIVEVVERISKELDGTIRNRASVHALDASDKPVTITRTATLVWRPDMRLMEYICEDGAGVQF